MPKPPQINYSPGIFNKFKSTHFTQWDDFKDIMWGLGYEMDCEHSFVDYCKTDPTAQSCKATKSRRQQFKNNLYILEHAPRKIVGDYLFSHYRYLTHWAYAFDEFDADYLQRIIVILENKYKEET